MFFQLILLSSATAIMAACNCGLGSGEDACPSGPRCTPLVVRPVEIPKPALPSLPGVPSLLGAAAKVASAVLPFPPPPGGPCTCQSSLVKPAVVPRPPPCQCCPKIEIKNTCSSSSSTSSSHQSEHQFIFGGSSPKVSTIAGPKFVILDEVPDKPVIDAPADPVSIQQALQMAHEQEAYVHHNEDKLSFGFRTIPKDVPLCLKKAGRNIPEENLFNLNGAILELKKKKLVQGKSLDEEAKEQLLTLAEEEEDARLNNNANFKQLSLSELGYKPAKIKAAPFIDITSSGSPASDLTDDGLSAPSTCVDGFKPGNVQFEQQIKKEVYPLPPPLPEPCDEDILVPAQAYTYMSSASSANNALKNVFMKRIGFNN